jgi:hypothetical protein
MPSQTALAPTTTTPRRRSLATVPAVAGIAFTASWVVGLTLAPASSDVDSTGAQIVAGGAGNEGALATQFLLTEGVASACLAVVAIAFGRAGLRAGAGTLGRLIMATGILAAALALVQCGLGLYLAGSVVPAADTDAAATVTEAFNRVDGVKMFVLAAMAAAGAVLARRTGLLPRFLQWSGAALVIAIITSGIGYALLASVFAQAAVVSLPLLLIFVTGSGVVLGRSRR